MRSNKITIISLFFFLVSTKKLNWFTNHYWLVISCKETGNLELSTLDGRYADGMVV